MRTAACQPRNAPIIPMSVTSPNPIASRRKARRLARYCAELGQTGTHQQARQAYPETPGGG